MNKSQKRLIFKSKFINNLKINIKGNGVIMGQQINKVEKRARRKAYLARCKAKIRQAVKASK